jgi:hypothetical protein
MPLARVYSFLRNSGDTPDHPSKNDVMYGRQCIPVDSPPKTSGAEGGCLMQYVPVIYPKLQPSLSWQFHLGKEQ